MKTQQEPYDSVNFTWWMPPNLYWLFHVISRIFPSGCVLNIPMLNVEWFPPSHFAHVSWTKAHVSIKSSGTLGSLHLGATLLRSLATATETADRDSKNSSAIFSSSGLLRVLNQRDSYSSHKASTVQWKHVETRKLGVSILTIFNSLNLSDVGSSQKWMVVVCKRRSTTHPKKMELARTTMPFYAWQNGCYPNFTAVAYSPMVVCWPSEFLAVFL